MFRYFQFYWGVLYEYTTIICFVNVLTEKSILFNIKQKLRKIYRVEDIISGLLGTERLI